MSVFARFSTVSRKRKLELFNELMKPAPTQKVLDVGGEVNPRHDRMLQFIDNYPWKDMLSVVNVSADHVSQIKDCYPEVDARVADACDLPWPDKYFDIVHSNAVIEHVGDFARQQRMAQEIMRVGKAWFVTTPNRWYPFEFHARLPFVTWLPGRCYVRCARVVSYNHVQKRYAWGMRGHDSLRLLGATQLARCFPDSRIVKQRVTFWPETLIAVGGETYAAPVAPQRAVDSG